jgi:hypothetical protein
VRLSDVLREVSESLSVLEPQPVPVPDATATDRPTLEPVGAVSGDASSASSSRGPAAELRAPARSEVRDVVAA